MNYKFITDIENPRVRRTLIVLMVICATPFLLAILLAEITWETLKAMVSIIRIQIEEIKPTIITIINKIKEVW